MTFKSSCSVLTCSRPSISFSDMLSSYTLGMHFETFIQGQLASGRYNNASEVVRDALRLMEERERRLIALDASIARGLADVEAGRVHEADAIFDETEARYASMARTVASFEASFFDGSQDRSSAHWRLYRPG